MYECVILGSLLQSHCSDGSSDIVGFTTLCGSMGAGKVSEMLDHLYTQVQTSKNFL